MLLTVLDTSDDKSFLWGVSDLLAIYSNSVARP